LKVQAVALNIKNSRTERLAAEVASMAGESKTQAISKALELRRQRLLMKSATVDRGEYLKRFLEEEIWPVVPEGLLGQPLTKADRESILGLGQHGV